MNTGAPNHGHAHAAHEHGSEHDRGHAHAHAHAGGHHSHAPEVTAANERVVLIGFVLTFSFMIVEVIGGLVSGSLALIADAGHMLIDAVALALAWAGFRFGRRRADGRRTFGYARLEVVAGFVNAASLIVLIGWIAWEAAGRLFAPQPILTGPMMIVAVVGLMVNVAVFLILRRADRDHVNIRGAMLHVLGDLLGSVAAILAAAIIWATGWTPVDPILSVLLSAILLRSAWVLLRTSLHILLEGAPSGLDVAGMAEALGAAVPGVAAIRHVHVWSISSGRPAATMEVMLSPGADPRTALSALKSALRTGYGIAHATIEIDFHAGAGLCSLSPEGVEPERAHAHDRTGARPTETERDE